MPSDGDGRMGKAHPPQDAALGGWVRQQPYAVPLSVVLEQLLRSNEKRFRGGLVFKARRFCVTHLKAESNKEEEQSMHHTCRSALESLGWGVDHVSAGQHSR